MSKLVTALWFSPKSLLEGRGLREATVPENFADHGRVADMEIRKKRPASFHGQFHARAQTRIDSVVVGPILAAAAGLVDRCHAVMIFKTE